MRQDRLLEELRRLAREQDVTADARWDALAAGTATPDEVADLRAMEARSPVGRAAYEAFRPIDGKTLDLLAEGVLHDLAERDRRAPARAGVGGLLARLMRDLSARTTRLRIWRRAGRPDRANMSGPTRSGDIIRGKYRLTEPMGSGAMGVVWEAIDERTGRKVALKLVLHPTEDYRRQLLGEARACSSLKHPNLVEVYDVDETESGDLFLAMELLSGETLAELLERRRRIEPPLAARIGLDIASALAAAHEAKIIHRDLKPANIFLHRESNAKESEFVVKVLDFGLAKSLAPDTRPTTITGMVVGSPAYMSPEQIRIDKNLDHRTDLWSLGIVLFEMLTGVWPFHQSLPEMVGQILSAPIPPPSSLVRHVPPEFDAIVTRCLERDRTLRYQSARDVVRALGQLAEVSQLSPVVVNAPQASSSTTGGIAMAPPPLSALPTGTVRKGRLWSVLSLASIVAAAAAALAGAGAVPSGWQAQEIRTIVSLVLVLATVGLLAYVGVKSRSIYRQLAAVTHHLESAQATIRSLDGQIATLQD